MTDTRAPLRLVFGIHLHQPVGNFDSVLRDHVRDVYLPLLRQLERRPLGRVMLHVSGPLLEWCEAHAHDVLDHVGRLVADGQVELLLAGMYEPILCAWPAADRIEQVAWMRDTLTRLFGACGDGLWLTERVWEPDLPRDLAAAGVRYVLVDDRHFLVSGFPRHALHQPWRTECDGHGVGVLAIDERLRYLIPFRPATEFGAYCRALHDAGRPLCVFADDGEKFGGWPGTHEWVYARGWFDAFCDELDALRADGTVTVCGGADAMDAVPCAGLAYLPTASYREMEAWALPAPGARRLQALEAELGPDRLAGPDGAFVRGGHWRNFLAKYAEANRLHKKTRALSALCRSRGDPRDARRAIGRAQCNDASWHGVFGGLYLPHLRHAVRSQLALAEGILRRGESLAAECVDTDDDGDVEVAVHAASFAAIVAPNRGGALVELTHFAQARNLADTLTRRLEAYHEPPLPRASPDHAPAARDPGTEGTPSIHELEGMQSAPELPPVDLADRALGVVVAIGPAVDASAYARAAYVPVASWARTRCSYEVDVVDDRLRVACRAPGFGVVWEFDAMGTVSAEWTWEASGLPADARVAIELSLAHGADVRAPDADEVWHYDIETLARSERGLAPVLQGRAIVAVFRASAGVGRVRCNGAGRARVT